MRPLTTVVVLVAIVVGTGVWWVFLPGPSTADFAPVRELLYVKNTRVDSMNAKTH